MKSQLEKKDEKTDLGATTSMWRTGGERETNTRDRLINNIRTPAAIAAAAPHVTTWRHRSGIFNSDSKENEHSKTPTPVIKERQL